MNTLLIRVLNKMHVLEKFNLSGTVVLNGKTFKVPLLGMTGLGNLLMNELWMVDVMNIVLKIENKTFIDIGVNVGQTLLKLRSVSSDMRYIGFEPNPGCISYVNKLIKENRLGNTELIPVGISSRSGIGKLIFYHENPADSYASIIEDPRPNKKIHRKEFIPLFNIENVKNSLDFDFISVLKIDVEGAELEVLESFKEELKLFNPIIFIEILPVYNAENSNRLERQTKIEQLLKELGYSIHKVVKDKSQLMDIVEIQEIGIHSNLKCCDYVMVPGSKLEAFKNYREQWLNKK